MTADRARRGPSVIVPLTSGGAAVSTRLRHHRRRPCRRRAGARLSRSCGGSVAGKPVSSRCVPAAVHGSPPTDTLAHEAFIVAADLDGNRSGARVRIGAGIEAAQLIASLGDDVERRELLIWDKQRDDLVVHETVRLGSCCSTNSIVRRLRGVATVTALLERVRATRLASCIGRQCHAAAQAHCFAATKLGGEWPAVDDKSLLATLPTWLAPFLNMRRAATISPPSTDDGA